MKIKKILQVKSLGAKPVYDIEMPTNHNMILDSGVVAHNCSYSYIARACAYLKFYYPTEWWTAVLSNASKDDLKMYWQSVNCEIKELPDINLSNETYSIHRDEKDQDYILPPINLIDGVGPAALSEIINKRPFNSFEDLVNRVDRRVVNKKTIFKLIFSGCLDRFFDPTLSEYDKLQVYLNLKAKIEGKKTPEAPPEEYRNLTALKRALIKKSIFKVSNVNFTEAATPKLEAAKIIHKPFAGSMVYALNFPGRKYHNVPLLDIEGYEKILNTYDGRFFGVIGYISKAEEKGYQGNKKKRLILHVEIEGRVIETIKWPNYGENNHGVSLEIEGSACLVIFSKREGKNEAFVEHIIEIERLDL